MKIQILMSVYNGASYLPIQLDSIAAQTVPEKLLLIRDDGSTDETPKILEKYCQKYPWISYYSDKNIGVQKSYFDLISRSDTKVNYIAFADQDDEWMPEKLNRAIYCLSQMEAYSGKGTPLLYCGAQELVDSALNPLKTNVSRVVKKTSLGNALVQNICTGCTAVGNQSLVTLIRGHFPQNMETIIMHDWWMYLTAACFGQVYYDQIAYIRYRQHSNNTFGAQTSHLELMRYRIKELTKPRGEIYRQVGSFLDAFYGCILEKKAEDKLKKIHKLLASERGAINRLSVAMDPFFFRQKRMDDIIFRGIVLIGKL